jgi:hypothetical protein
MPQLVLAAALELGAQRRARGVGGHRVEPQELLGVVRIDEGLDRRDGGVDHGRAEQRGQCAGQPSGDPPGRQQSAAMRRRQVRLDHRQVAELGLEMMGGEGPQRRVARDRQDAAIDHDRARLARVIAAQVGGDVGRPGGHDRRGTPGATHRQEHAVGGIEQSRHRAERGDAPEPRGARQRLPQRREAAHAVDQRAVGTAHVKAGERRTAGQVGAERRLVAGRRVDPFAGLGAGLSPVGGDLSGADGARAVEIDGERGGRRGRVGVHAKR